jgi:hypothetical protein
MSVIQSDIVPVCHASGEVKNVVVADTVGGLRAGVHLTSAPSTVWNEPFFIQALNSFFDTDGHSFPAGYLIHTPTMHPPLNLPFARLPNKTLLDAANTSISPGSGFVCWICNEFDIEFRLINSLDMTTKIDPFFPFVVIPIGTSTQLIFYRHLDDSGWTVRQM